MKATPADGGALVSNLDSTRPGFQNYTRKLDFRRVLDEEVRREGHDYFKVLAEQGVQPFPQLQSFTVPGFVNGGFELDSNADDAPDGWVWTQMNGTTGSRDSATFNGGSYSFKFVTTTTDGTGTLTTAEFLPVAAGKIWTLGWAHKVDVAGRKVKVCVNWYDATDALIGTSRTVLETTSTTTAWASNSIDIVNFPGAVSAKIVFHSTGVVSATTFGTVYFDSVTLTQRDAVTLPITLVHLAERPNGQTALVVGTKTTLYRFYAYDGEYVAKLAGDGYVTSDYVATGYVAAASSDVDYVTLTGDGTPYFSSQVGEWRIIGSGFSEDGKRWEAVNINGYAVFNNGVDLPVTYRVEDFDTLPIYELRDMGVANVGTIAEVKGLLACGDIGGIDDSDLEASLNHSSYGSATIVQNGALQAPYELQGHQGYMLRFDGVDDYVIANYAGLDAAFAIGPASGLAVECVFKASSLTSPASLVSREGIGSPPNTYKIDLGHNGSVVTVNWANLPQMIGTTPLKVGVWYHAAATFDGAYYRLYLNGVEENVLQNPGGFGAGTGGWQIGRNAVTSLRHFAGCIAEVRLFDEIRTAAQIYDKRFDDLNEPPGLLAKWKFNEGSGTTTYDGSDNVFHGTLTGGATLPTWVVSDSPTDQYLMLPDTAISAGLSFDSALVKVLLAAHGITANQMVSFTATGALPTGITAGRWYYAISGLAGGTIDPNFFFLSVNRESSATSTKLNFTDNGSGGVSLIKNKDWWVKGMVGSQAIAVSGFKGRAVAYVGDTFAMKVSDPVTDLISKSLSFWLINDTTRETTVWAGEEVAGNTTTNKFTRIGHGLRDKDRVKFAGTVPTGITAGQWYWVMNATSTTFQVSATWGGAFVALGTTGANVTMTTARCIGSIAAGVTLTGDQLTDIFYPGQTIRVTNGTFTDYRIVTVAADLTLTVSEAFSFTSTVAQVTAVSDYTVFCSSAIFTSASVGRKLFPTSGGYRLVTGIVPWGAGKMVSTNSYRPLTAQLFELENVTSYGRFDAGKVSRIQYRVLYPAIPGNPRRFAAGMYGSMSQGYDTLTLDYPIKSLEQGSDLLIPGAGIDGTNLTSTIIHISEDHKTLIMDQLASTSITSELVRFADSVDSMVGFEDLSEDSSPIVKMLGLQGRLVIYKRSRIYVAAYTGRTTAPFEFRDIATHYTPAYRNTVISVAGGYHLYAGEDRFYKFDLNSQAPEIMPVMEAASDLFYSKAAIERDNDIYAANNEVTGEVFIQFPTEGETKGICLDYRHMTVSETGAAFSAMATVEKPSDISGGDRRPMWCVGGTAAGTIVLYGATNAGNALWGGLTRHYTRLGQNYRSVLAGGLFGVPFQEISITGYLLESASQSSREQSGFTVNFYGYRNAVEPARTLGTATKIQPGNFIPAHFLTHYIQDEIVIDGVNNPFRIASRTIEYRPVKSRSGGRR